MKQSRAQRKRYNEAKRSGYQDGFIEGYNQGLHDGNPFIALGEAVGKILKNVSEALTDPAFIEAVKESQRLEAEKELEMIKCDMCLHRDGCADADTADSFTCEHFKKGEVWNGYHGHCVQPEGTFENIWNDEGGDDDGI